MTLSPYNLPCWNEWLMKYFSKLGITAIFLLASPCLAHAGNFHSLMHEADYVVLGTVKSESAVKLVQHKNKPAAGFSDTLGAPSLDNNPDYYTVAIVTVERVFKKSGHLSNREKLKICSGSSLAAGDKYIFSLSTSDRYRPRCLDAMHFEVRDFTDDAGKTQTGVLVTRGMLGYLPSQAKFVQHKFKSYKLNLSTGPERYATIVLDTFIPYIKFVGAVRDAVSK